MVRARESGTRHSVLATHLSHVQEMLFAVFISLQAPALLDNNNSKHICTEYLSTMKQTQSTIHK